MAQRLDDVVLPRLSQSTTPQIVAIYGSTGCGKSVIVNTLTRSEAATAGPLRPTTRRPVLVANQRDLDALAGHPVRTMTTPLAAANAIRGRAIVELPDTQLAERNDRTAVQRLLRLADLRIAVSSGIRYGDGLLWEMLLGQDDAVRPHGLIVNRVQPSDAGAIQQDLTERLAALPYENPIAVIVQEMPTRGQRLADDDGPQLDEWLAELVPPAADAAGQVSGDWWTSTAAAICQDLDALEQAARLDRQEAEALSDALDEAWQAIKTGEAALLAARRPARLPEEPGAGEPVAPKGAKKTEGPKEPEKPEAPKVEGTDGPGEAAPAKDAESEDDTVDKATYGSGEPCKASDAEPAKPESDAAADLEKEPAPDTKPAKQEPAAPDSGPAKPEPAAPDSTEPAEPKPREPEPESKKPEPEQPEPSKPKPSKPEPPKQEDPAASKTQPLPAIARVGDPRIVGLPAHIELIEVCTRVLADPLAGLLEPAATPTSTDWRERATQAGTDLVESVNWCAEQLIDLVRAQTRDRVRTAWDSEDGSPGAALVEALDAAIPSVPASEKKPTPPTGQDASSPSGTVRSTVRQVAVWLGDIDAAVVAGGDTTALEALSRAVGRPGVGALAGAAALDCPGAGQYLVGVGGQAGADIVEAAYDALSAGLLTAARDIVDKARSVLEHVTPGDGVGRLMSAHRAHFAEEDE
jgi:hypothetical protein